MGNDQFLDFLSKVYANISKSLKPGGVFYVWGIDAGPDAEFEMGLRTAGDLHESMQLIWVKNVMTFHLGRLDYNRQHEVCKYGWKTGAAHYFCQDNTLSTIL